MVYPEKTINLGLVATTLTHTDTGDKKTWTAAITSKVFTHELSRPLFIIIYLIEDVSSALIRLTKSLIGKIGAVEDIDLQTEIR